MGSSSRGRLANFLKRYSAKTKGCSVFKQWTLIEVRDVGKRRDLICPCGRSGLRYICFIRNFSTDVQTYVGSYCVRRFTNKYVPHLLKLMETLAINGITGRYLGSGGHRGRHIFNIRGNSKLVRSQRLLNCFFSGIPVEKVPRRGWQLTVYIRHNQYTLRTPGLQLYKWYNLKLGPVTIKASNRPVLRLYADRIRTSGL